MAQTIGSLDLNAFSDLYNDSNQYFWFESNASATYGAGVHVTLVPDTSFISNPTGQNILMNTEGFSIRNGLLPMMTLDNDSLDFNVVDINNSTYANVATFGADGTELYDSTGALLFKTHNNGDYFIDVVDYPVLSDGITPKYRWEPNETTTITATITVDVDMPYLNCIKEISITFEDIVYGTNTVVDATFTPSSQTYTGNGYTISYSHPSTLENNQFSLSITKNVAEDKYIEVYDIKVTYDLGYSTSTTVCGVHSATEDVDTHTTQKAFVVGAGNPQYGKDAFSVGYNGNAEFSDSLRVRGTLNVLEKIEIDEQPLIKFAEYDSGQKTLAAQSATIVDATISSPPSGYVGYIIRVRIQNGTGGINASGCNPFDYYFASGTTVRAQVRNNFTSQAKVHVLFTVIWVNSKIVG